MRLAKTLLQAARLKLADGIDGAQPRHEAAEVALYDCGAGVQHCLSVLA